jgi:hypothetical protein
MKRFLVFVFAVVLLAPVQASAHQPVALFPSETSAAKGPLLVDGTVSFAILDSLVSSVFILSLMTFSISIDFITSCICTSIISLITCLITSLVLAYPFMLMWNYAVVAAFSIAKPITYWIAFILMFFISIFIKSKTSFSIK